MLRRRSVRLRIIVLVLVPVIALVGLYGLVLTLTMGNYLSLRQAEGVRAQVTIPVSNVQLDLSKERLIALQYLADPSHDELGQLLAQEAKADGAITTFSATSAHVVTHASIGERRAIRTWSSELATLRELRATVVSLAMSRAAADVSYSTIITGGNNVLNQAILPLLASPGVIQANNIVILDESLQTSSEESNLVGADLAAHSYPGTDQHLVNQLIVQHRQLWNQAMTSLDPAYQRYFTRDIPVAASARLASMENQITVGPRSALRVSPSAWASVNKTYDAGFLAALRGASAALRSSAVHKARVLILRLIIIAGLGLLAIVVAITIAVIVSRTLLTELDELRESALALSSQRLPAVLRRLRAGEIVDVDIETPQLALEGNEIGQLRQAINFAAKAAIEAAVDEVAMRRGVNDVFRNLARRNQSLLTRQLELLDAMERRVHDPEELADLFRVDHLTTRMRRHAEGLLIVAGGSSGRVWREPVPIVDVMRAAIAEIEDYTRIRVTSRSSASVAGHAVADVIHLLAELVENATTFSPANTPVRIESDNVAKGVIVEIEDRGLGMTDEQVAEINTRLLDPPLLDLSGSEQLGLFIAGQLAARHSVRITMRGSAYGGIVAVVLIPSALVIDPGFDEPPTFVGIRELGGRPVPQLPGPPAELAPSEPDDDRQLAGASAGAAEFSLPGTGPTRRESSMLMLGQDSDLFGDAVGTGPLPTTPAPASPGPASPVPAGIGSQGPLPISQMPSSPGLAGLGPASPMPANPIPAGAASTDPITAAASATGPAYDGLTTGRSVDDLLAGWGSGGPADPGNDYVDDLPRRMSAEPATGFGLAGQPLDGNARSTNGWPSAPAGRRDGTDGDRPATLNERLAPLPSRPAASDLAGEQAASADRSAAGSVGWPDYGTTRAGTNGWLNLTGEPARGPADLDGQGTLSPSDFGGPGYSDASSSSPSSSNPSSSSGSYNGAGSSYAGHDTASYDSPGYEPAGLDDAPPLPKRQAATPALSFGSGADDSSGFGAITADHGGAPDLDGLPVRVRQASLAPQLRESAGAAHAQQFVPAPQMPGELAAESAQPSDPSPDAARSFMSALQRGWERGRSMADQLTDEPDGEQP
jgi:anti-sigma regulatory factor (Ser/Thr protein kinase)